ncbi:MAG: zinc-ribbon domain-containing protein [Oscillospiraceae bacterium]
MEKENKKMVLCEECGEELEKSANFCPNCGARNSNKKAKGCKVCLIFSVLIIAGTVVLLVSNSKESKKFYKKMEKKLF